MPLIFSRMHLLLTEVQAISNSGSVEVISCQYVVPVALSQLWQVPGLGLKSSTLVPYTLEPQTPIPLQPLSGHLSTGAKPAPEQRTKGTIL